MPCRTREAVVVSVHAISMHVADHSGNTHIHNSILYVVLGGLWLQAHPADIKATILRWSYLRTSSFHPIGISAAATSSTPRSVARRLNCDAAFLVSSTSTRMPSAVMHRLASGLSGRISGPRPRMRRSALVSHGPARCQARPSVTCWPIEPSLVL